MNLRADQRLFLSYLALIVALVVTLVVGVDRLLRNSLVGLVEEGLGRELALAIELYRGSDPADADSVADVVGRLTGRRATIVAPDGTVRGESTADGAELAALENHGRRPEILGARETGMGRSIRGSETVGEQLLYLAAVEPGGDVVRLAVPLAMIDGPIDRVQRGVVLVGGVAVFLSALLSFGFSVRVTEPLRRIQQTARALAAGDLSRRLGETRTDEFGEVARSLDALAAELQRRIVALEDEQTRTGVLFDTMSEGVVALAADGTVLRANPAAQRMFSLPERVAVSTPEAVSRRAEFLAVVRRALDGYSVSATEITADERSLLATAEPLPDGGAVVVILDISELRRLEGVRRDFVANASHELKTPLTAIRGYSETLLDPELPQELRSRFAEVVRSNADRLQRIVDDLLDLSRIETGGWVVHSALVDVDRAVDEAWTETLRSTPEREIQFSMQRAAAAGTAFCDPGALRQILTNLFGNAIRYTPDGGRVMVSVELEAARQGAQEDWLRFEVTDSGSGIPTAHIPRVFERFYRVDPARSREEGGTGLGLAIVKHLVESHGGSIEAESRLGSGTTIRFRLPAADRRDPEVVSGAAA